MSETLALFRLAIMRHRRAAIWLLGIVTGCEAIALLIVSFVPQVDGDTAALGATVALFPPMIASLMLFDYGQTKNMAGAESGCDEWLLRMPVASWKIALPPIVLKSLWVMLLCGVLAATAASLGVKDAVVRGLAPGLCVAAGLIWVLYLAWRPFRSGWLRIISLLAMLPAIYLTLGAAFITAQAENRQWYPLSLAVSALIYAVGVWATIRAVELARTNGRGIIPATGNSQAVSAEPSCARREHASAVRALVWHDLSQTRGLIRLAIVLGVVPAVVIFPLLIPISAVTVVGAVIVFVYIGAIAMSGIGGNPADDQRNRLPPYLAASPLKTSTIAWTRLGTILCGSLAMWSFILLVFAGWACWPENRDVWYRWATQRAIDANVPASEAFSIGWRWSVAMVLATVALVLSRFIAFLWVGMAGRQWFTAGIAIALGISALLVLGVVLRWFLQQSDWEGTMQSLYRGAEWIPVIAAVWLAFKAVGVVSAAVAVWRSRLATTKQIAAVFMIWGTITVTLAVALTWLIPDPRASLLGCLVATTVSIPLARVLILPISLDFNRRR